MVYGFENEIPLEKEKFRAYYNDLYFHGELKVASPHQTDTEMATMLGREHSARGFEAVCGSESISEQKLSILNDGLMLSNASSFYRKKGAASMQGVRYLVNECLSFPMLNYFAYCMNLRTQASQDFLDFPTVMDCVYDHEKWTAEAATIRCYPHSPLLRNSFNGLFLEGRRPQQSLSEVYCLQTYRKEFASLPPLNTKKLKIIGIEGFRLEPADISVHLRTWAKQNKNESGIDVQGGLLNNPSQTAALCSELLANTLQKGHNDALINVDIEKHQVSDFRERVLSIEELNRQVVDEMLR